MINIRSILKLAENDGMTLKKGNKITYKSGWQVATEGVECKTAREAINAVKAYGGNCECGGTYELSAASQYRTFRSFYYTCDTCGHTEEFSHLMK